MYLEFTSETARKEPTLETTDGRFVLIKMDMRWNYFEKVTFKVQV
jgi:hypothetical protein